jgi:Fur family transcriptional regulator, ferric uptake regulator
MRKKCCDIKITIQQAHDILLSHGLSRTEIKTNILILLAQSHTPQSANEIYNSIGKNKCNSSTIWRTLKQFHEKGIIRELNLGEDFFRYEFINQDKQDKHHHHHIRCRNCGDIKQLQHCDLSVFEKMIGQLGFKRMEHYLEFTGICANCD